MKQTLAIVVMIVAGASMVLSQDIGYQRGRYKSVLAMIKSDIKKNYYDANFREIDLDAKFKSAEERISQATSIGQINGIIAQTLLDFDDSHLFYLPPGKVNRVDYGFEMKMVGEKCFVSNVRKDSDAEKKGLQRGDEIYSIDGFGPTRENMWKIDYSYRALRPRPAVKLQVIKPDKKEASLDIAAKITEGQALKGVNINDYQALDAEQEDRYSKATKQWFYEGTEGLTVWKMPSFSLTPEGVDDQFDRIRKRKGALILDLRGNGGGRVDMLLKAIGNVFQGDVKVFDERRRKETKEVIAKTRGKDFFDGKMVVLIDNRSGSASEIFSRVMQLEKRAVVLGDTSSGAVMESIQFPHKEGLESIIFFGVSVTIADLIMKDGKSLEKVGVKPDELILPTGADLASRRDPVLARAAEILGFKMTAEEAGKMFPDVDELK